MITVTDGNRLPLTGKITRIGDDVNVNIAYIRSPGGNVLSLNPPYSKPIAAGSVIQVGSPGLKEIFIDQGGGCEISANRTPDLTALLAGLVVGLALRRRA